MKILIVEDDDQTASILRLMLDRHGHSTTLAPTAAEALAEFHQAQTILLDLGLPDLDGHELCRQLREHTDAPIIVVTARSDEVDRLMAFHFGADDYVTKPFSTHELLARIDAVARRATRSIAASSDPPKPPAPSQVYRLGELQLDLRTRRVAIGDRPVRLTRKEFDLLTVLMEDTGTVKTREEILARVWDENWFGSTRTLDVHVGSLRSKLGSPGWIETIRGVGYRVDIPQPDPVA